MLDNRYGHNIANQLYFHFKKLDKLKKKKKRSREEGVSDSGFFKEFCSGERREMRECLENRWKQGEAGQPQHSVCRQ